MGQEVISVACFAVLTWLTSLVSDSIITMMQSGLFDYISNWVTIPIVSQVIIWGQVISITVVIAIRIGVGISQGILRDEVRAPEYLFRSVGAVVLIGLMPIFCDLIIVAGQTMMSDVMGMVSTSKELVDEIQPNYLDYIVKGVINTATDITGQTLTVVLNNVVGTFVLILMLIVFFALLKRQVEMLVIGVAAPWAGIKIATENQSSDYWAYLTNLFGMCVVQWVQALFLAIGMQTYSVWIKLSGTNDLFSIADVVNPEPWYAMALMIAVLLAAINVPSLLDRWTFSGSGSSSVTNLLMRTAMRPVQSGASTVGGIMNGKK